MIDRQPLLQTRRRCLAASSIVQQCAMLVACLALSAASTGVFAQSPDNTLQRPSLRDVDNDSRELQNIVITYPRDEGTTAPTMAPTASSRPQKTVICRDITEDVLALRTIVRVRYQAETDSTSDGVPTEYIDEALPDFIGVSAVTLAAQLLCNADDVAELNGGDRQMEGYLSDCILSVSSGDPAVGEGDCTPTLDASQSCHQYLDEFIVLHTDACTRDDILLGAMMLVEDGMEAPEFLTEVNALSIPSTGVTVTKLSMLDPPSVSAVENVMYTTTGGLTTLGKFFVFAACFAGVSVMASLYVWKRHVNRRNRRLEDELKSCQTVWSSPNGDNRSYMEPDFRDLAMRHSKLNVHQCKSALCKVCRPNLGKVHIMPVPKPSVTQLRLDTVSDYEENDLPERPRSRRRSSQPPLELEPFEEHRTAAEVETEAVLPPSKIQTDNQFTLVRIANAKRAKGGSSENSYKHVVL